MGLLTKNGYANFFIDGIETIGNFGIFLQSTNQRQAKARAVELYDYWHLADAEEFLGGNYETHRPTKTKKTFHLRPKP